MTRYEWTVAYLTGQPIAVGRAAARFVLQLGPCRAEPHARGAARSYVVDLEDLDCTVRVTARRVFYADEYMGAAHG